MKLSNLIDKTIEEMKVDLMKQAEIASTLDDDIKSFFIENPIFSRIQIQAYTPGFNDGDPCVHQQYVRFGLSVNDPRHPNFKKKDGKDDDDEDTTLDSWDLDYKLKNLSGDEHQMFQNALAMCKKLDSCKGMFYQMFNTDWALEFYLNKDNALVANKTDYDCGY